MSWCSHEDVCLVRREQQNMTMNMTMISQWKMVITQTGIFMFSESHLTGTTTNHCNIPLKLWRWQFEMRERHRNQTRQSQAQIPQQLHRQNGDGPVQPDCWGVSHCLQILAWKVWEERKWAKKRKQWNKGGKRRAGMRKGRNGMNRLILGKWVNQWESEWNGNQLFISKKCSPCGALLTTFTAPIDHNFALN